MEEFTHRRSVFMGLLTFFALTALMLVFAYKMDSNTFSVLKTTAPGWLILLILLGFTYNLADAAICRTIVREHVSGFSMAKALDVTYLSVFGNVITLAAGSVPMQALILYRFATYCLFL